MEIKPQAVENGSYMRTLTNKELVAEMVADHASFYYGQIRKKLDRAILTLHKSLEISPRNPENWSNLGKHYIARSKRLPYEPFGKFEIEAGQSMIQKAKNMGISPPLKPDYRDKPQPSKLRAGS